MRIYTMKVCVVAADDMPEDAKTGRVTVYTHKSRVKVLEEVMSYFYNPLHKEIDDGMCVLSYGPLEYEES